MKYIKFMVIFAITLFVLNANTQEKRIKFNKGTLKICSSKNFQIKGYDGDEVIIESLHEKTYHNHKGTILQPIKTKLDFVYFGKNKKKQINKEITEKRNRLKKIKEERRDSIINKWVINPEVKGTSLAEINYEIVNTKRNNDSIYIGEINFFNNDLERKKGLKKIGNKNEDEESGIYFMIEQINGELIFKDKEEDQLVMWSNESYKIKIPNSIKLNWQTKSCTEEVRKIKKYRFYNSKASSLSNFDGEVAISSSLSNTKLVDVTGPVSINTIGGNVTIIFDKKLPEQLYSVYSNNGFIDITMPKNSDVKLDVSASDIFSDINFKLEDEKNTGSLQHMKLKLNSGKVRMKLNANLGNIYLRKK